MPGTPTHVMRQGAATAPTPPATILLFSQIMRPGQNSTIFGLTEKGIYYIQANQTADQMTSGFGTIVLQTAATATGTFAATSISFTQQGTQYFDLTQSAVGTFFNFTNTQGGQVMVSMDDPWPDQ